LQVAGLDKCIDMPFDCRCNGGVGRHDPNLDIPQLGGLREICRPDKGPGAVNNDAFGVKAGPMGLNLDEAARIIEQDGQPWSGPFVPNESLRKSTQQCGRNGSVTGRTADIKTEDHSSISPHG